MYKTTTIYLRELSGWDYLEFLLVLGLFTAFLAGVNH
jgi:hypothetical protein